MMRERRRWLVKVDPIDERARRERLDRRTADRLRLRNRAVEQARQRPEAVVVRVKGEKMPTGRVAVLIVPATASESAKQVAEVAALIATCR
jgi:hypothetical protein